MKVEIKVPAMGESISEATVGNIIKPSGSKVNMDDEILELETDKVNQVLFAPQAGVIELTVKSEDVVKIGQVIGTIDSEAKESAAPSAKPPEQPKAAPEAKPKPVQEKPSVAEPAPKPAAEKQEKATPASGQAARYLKENYLTDISSQKKEGVPQPKPEAPPKEVPAAPAAQAPQQAKGRESRRKMTRIRQVIAKRLVEAQQSTAMLTTFNEIDMSQVILLREKYKDAFVKQYGVKLGFMSFFVKACVTALKEIPDLNSYVDGDEIVTREYYDIGIAVGTDRGLVVPVVRNCDQLSFAGIEGAIETFAKKARTGGLTVDDLQGGGFTITNGGTYGSMLSTPIINPPQSGILGMHKITKRAVVVDDEIVIRPIMYVALSYDHRIVDGKEAVTFLVEIKKFLEDPARLVIEI
jgi:2-oxoglutarate dehydrogenase E2 component (dihydrolipoamide succinyltransferase)